MSTPDAPRTGNEANAFLRAQHQDPTKDWHRRCLELARTARGLPAVYPSAFSAAHATPAGERVHDVGDLRRGMVVYYDDPHDGNPAAHVGTVAGWRGNKITGKLPDVLVWSNDVVPGDTGAIGLVAGDYFPKHWGDPLLFGATWLNGYNFRDLDRAPVPDPGRESIGATFDRAIADLRKLIRTHRANGHPRIVAALTRDLAELLETRKQFP